MLLIMFRLEMTEGLSDIDLQDKPALLAFIRLGGGFTSSPVAPFLQACVI